MPSSLRAIVPIDPPSPRRSPPVQVQNEAVRVAELLTDLPSEVDVEGMMTRALFGLVAQNTTAKGKKEARSGAGGRGGGDRCYYYRQCASCCAIVIK